MSSKRKGDDLGSSARRSRRADDDGNNEDDHGTSQQSYLSTHPLNKDGFRYCAAEPDPIEKKFLSPKTTNDGLPILFFEPYRPSLIESPVCMSLHDRAAQLSISDDRLTVTGEKGYCMARATHGVNYGVWYFEATVLQTDGLSGMPAPHVRIGWSRKQGNLQGPCGYDAFSYSWRDVNGAAFHQSKGHAYGESFGPGDTLGFVIVLPKPQPSSLVPQPYKDQKLVDYKGLAFFEEKDSPENKDTPKIAQGSKLICFRNGVSQGVMFENIPEGVYFPSVAAYMGGKVQVNFGPNFKYSPSISSLVDSKMTATPSPFSEAVHVLNAQTVLNDLLTKATKLAAM